MELYHANLVATLRPRVHSCPYHASKSTQVYMRALRCPCSAENWCARILAVATGTPRYVRFVSRTVNRILVGASAGFVRSLSHMWMYVPHAGAPFWVYRHSVRQVWYALHSACTRDESDSCSTLVAGMNRYHFVILFLGDYSD